MYYQVKVEIIATAVLYDMVHVEADSDLDAERHAASIVWSLWDRQTPRKITIKEVKKMTEGYTPLYTPPAPQPVAEVPVETPTTGYQPYFNQATGRFHDPETNQMVPTPVNDSGYVPYQNSEEVLEDSSDDYYEPDDFWGECSDDDCDGFRICAGDCYVAYGAPIEANPEPTTEELAQTDEDLGYSVSTEKLGILREKAAAAVAAVSDAWDALLETLADV